MGGQRAVAEKIRVVYVDHTAQLSGGELALVRLLQATRERVDATVVLAEDGPLVPLLRDAGARVEILPLDPLAREMRKDSVTPGLSQLRSALAVLAYVRRLRSFLRRERPDLVHTNSLKADVYGGLAGRAAGIPVVWHVHDRIATDYLPRPAVLMIRSAARVVPASIIVNSRATAATLPERRGRTTLVDNVVERPGVPAAQPRPDGGLVVGMVGRLAPWKGQDVFLRAFAKAFAGRSGVTARVIGTALFGEDEYAAGLRELAEDLAVADRVEFRGFREDVWAELDALDVLVHCSITPEPFGQVVVEGMVAGLAVVAAAAGGPAEVITPDVDGLLVAPGDVDGLAQALTRLADDPGLRRRLGDAGRTTAKRFSGDVGGAQLLAAYERVRGGPRRRRPFRPRRAGRSPIDGA